MKKIYLELDISGTQGNEAWHNIEKPQGFIEALIQKNSTSSCGHDNKNPHLDGEWREISVKVEATCLDAAIGFYKGIDRILAVETEE